MNAENLRVSKEDLLRYVYNEIGPKEKKGIESLVEKNRESFDELMTIIKEKHGLKFKSSEQHFEYIKKMDEVTADLGHVYKPQERIRELLIGPEKDKDWRALIGKWAEQLDPKTAEAYREIKKHIKKLVTRR